MTYIVAAVATMVVLFGQDTTQSGHSQPHDMRIAVIRDSRGEIQGMFQTHTQPYKEGMALPLRLALPRQQDLMTADGRALNGFGFYAWDESGGAKIKIFVLLPASGAPNEYLWKRNDIDLNEALRPRPLAEYKMSLGEKRPIQEMSQLGVVTMTIELGGRVPPK